MKLKIYPDAPEHYKILVSSVKKKMIDNYLLFILSQKANGNVSSIKCRIFNMHSFGLLKLMKTILYPYIFDQKYQKQNQKSKSKGKKYLTNTLQQYETTEKMIAVQKILQEEKFILIFIVGVFIGLNLNKTDIKPFILYSSSNMILQEELESNQQQSLNAFSFAYNTTHLWSMRLADENYYRIIRRLPCRTVNYVDQSINETMNHCSQTTINEFSVKETVNAQKWFYEHQHPVDCSNKKFAVIHNYAWSGIGSTIHQVVWAFGEALAQNRIAVYETPGNWVYGDCKFGTLDCFFLPITNCSIPSKIDGNQTIRIPANIGHWEKPRYPDVFQNRTLTWYRSQLLFYLMRYNAQTLAHVQHLVAQSFDPPSVDLHHPYIALYVRRSDKVTNREMSQAYPLSQYFNLFDNDTHQTNITTIYINSEDNNVFNEFEQVNKNKTGYYKLLRVKTRKDIVFGSLMGMPMNERGKIILEFLTDLFIEANADLHAGTLTSNWCRLVDEMRLVLGKFSPYYTPENGYYLGLRRKK
ncbi:unnamed protein product [Adineta steineri]|uniref:Alpha-(1,6)-fucosyltransferase N- and catalytic domain-containing protein n=1 Tax=Adineta steineri TaxID=433720 RepID=A0A815ENU9_9BILA|nr:unnamed protein product [Adineta steineri]CAF3718671.1 unnamed protein product [Adineta steineri]